MTIADTKNLAGKDGWSWDSGDPYLNDLPNHWMSGKYAPVSLTLSFDQPVTIVEVRAHVDQGNPGYRVDEIWLTYSGGGGHAQQIDLWAGARVQNDRVMTRLREAEKHVTSVTLKTSFLANNWVGWYSIEVWGYVE